MRLYRSVKVFIIYLGYSCFLKLFHFSFSQALYVEIDHEFGHDIFLQGMGDGFFEKLRSLIGLNIAYDLFWLLPYTVMNVYLFLQLIDLLESRVEDVYHVICLRILQVFLVWSLIAFVVGLNGGDAFQGVYSPYSSFSIVYTVVGNFVFASLFIPLWKWKLGYWFQKPE